MPAIYRAAGIGRGFLAVMARPAPRVGTSQLIALRLKL